MSYLWLINDYNFNGAMNMLVHSFMTLVKGTYL